jgi:4-oxalomesaconate tautomerase
MSYEDTGVRCTMLRGGTSRGLFFEPGDLPADEAERDDLLLRLMGTPDPRQIDGLGGSTSLTSKVAVVGRSGSPDADVDYLFLQLGVDQPTVSDQQNCGNILAGVGPFAVERGLVPGAEDETTVRIRMVNSDSIAVASFPTPGGRPEYRGDVEIAGVPGTAAPVVLGFTDTEGSATGSLLPTGSVRDTIEGVEATCVDNGMPVVVALASSFGLTGYETHAELAADAALLERIDAFRTKAGALMGLGDVTGNSVPKTALLAPARDGGQVCTRSFIPVRPHTSIGVLAAVSVVTGMLLPGAVGHELTGTWPRDRSQVDVEHPTGHLMVDVIVDADASPPRVLRSGVVRTARKLFDGTAFPRT